MTDAETMQVIERLILLWPRADMSEAVISEYQRVLRKYPLEDMTVAVDEVIEESKFLPTIAELVEHCDLPIQSRRMTADQLHWSGHKRSDYPDWMLPPETSTQVQDEGRIT